MGVQTRPKDGALFRKCPLPQCPARREALQSRWLLWAGHKDELSQLSEPTTCHWGHSCGPKRLLHHVPLKRETPQSQWYLYQILTNFQNPFTGWFSSKSAVKWLLEISPHTACCITNTAYSHCMAVHCIPVSQSRGTTASASLTSTQYVTGQLAKLSLASPSFGWGKDENATSAGWQVTLCDPTRDCIAVRLVANCHSPFTYWHSHGTKGSHR